MSKHSNDNLSEVIYDVIESSLQAQLRAIRRLRKPHKKTLVFNRRMSQIDMAYDILIKAGVPLHISEIIKKIKSIHKTEVDRESLVSAITKKVKREQRFIKVGKNIFGIRREVTV